MQDQLFDPQNEWHDYKGCHLQRSQAVFAVRREFVFVENPCVEEIHLIDLEQRQMAASEQSDINTHQPMISTNTSTEMVAGYIVLSKRTTLSVFRSILPDTARFFFLSTPLLRLLRQWTQTTPQWCRDALLNMEKKPPATCRRPVDTRRINKRLSGCLQFMSAGFYTGLACLVLFDARGPVESCSTWGPMYTSLTICFTVLLLSLKYLPTILHRPQRLVDSLCNDLLCITAHAVCIALIVDPCLRHGCAIHSACFILQQRFIGHMPSVTTLTVVHTTLVLLLFSAYVYGPRISDVKQFMLSAVCPHALEIFAQVLSHAHRMVVMSWSTD